MNSLNDAKMSAILITPKPIPQTVDSAAAEKAESQRHQRPSDRTIILVFRIEIGSYNCAQNKVSQGESTAI